MSLSVATAKSELESMLHGTTLSQIGNVAGVFNRAARQLLLDIDPQETKRSAILTLPVYCGTYDYITPTDLKGNKIIDLYPQGTRNMREVFTQVFNQDFDVNKNYPMMNTFTMLHNSGQKVLRISYNNTSRNILLNPASMIAGNGSWYVSGTASNLSVDNQFMDNGQPVLKFDITTGAGYLNNTTIPALDLTNHLNQSGIFLDIIIPSGGASKLTSVDIRIGSDPANYWEVTGLNTTFQGKAFIDGLNNLYTLFSSMTKVGNPDITKITCLRMTFTASAAITGLEFAQIWSKLGFISSVEYYSKYLFSDIAGIWKETTTDDSDLINLDTESYNIFMYLLQIFANQQALGQNASFDAIFSDTGYQKAVIRYKSLYKSEVSNTHGTYYRKTFNGYRDLVGRNVQH
jgi:hypothetical protein